MAKASNGILGAVSGKIGGVVGANWKSVRYLRAYVVPGASETDLQLAQRARFAAVVADAKPFVGTVFNPYYDKFLPRTSGFNRYVTENIPKKPDYTPITLHTVTSGPLYQGSGFVSTYATGTGTATLSWTADHGVDGLDTDVAITWARHRPTHNVYFGAPTTRLEEAVEIACPAGLTATDFDCGIFFVKMSGSLVVKISRNLSDEASAI